MISKQLTDSIFDKADNYIILKYKRITRRISKLVDFIKLGWNDYDWDYGYTYEVLKYKLEKQMHYFQNSDIATDNKRSAKICRVALKALDRFYGEKAQEYYTKYNEKKLPFKYTWSFVPAEDPGYSKMLWIYEDSRLPLSSVDLALKDKIGSQALRYETRMLKKYKKIFYKTLYKHAETLWD